MENTNCGCSPTQGACEQHKAQNALVAEVADAVSEADEVEGCQHDAGEDHTTCVECGRCREDLDCQGYCRDCGGHECEIAHPNVDEATDEECNTCDNCKHVAHYAGRCWKDGCFCESEPDATTCQECRKVTEDGGAGCGLCYQRTGETRSHCEEHLNHD